MKGSASHTNFSNCNDEVMLQRTCISLNIFEFWAIASLTLGKSLRMRYCFRSETNFIRLSPALTMFEART